MSLPYDTNNDESKDAQSSIHCVCECGKEFDTYDELREHWIKCSSGEKELESDAPIS